MSTLKNFLKMSVFRQQPAYTTTTTQGQIGGGGRRTNC